MPHRVIHLHPLAPPKPPTGQACNGCGACCAWAPCPVGMLVSGRRQGTCKALQWHEPARLYLCGMVHAPRQVLRWLPRWTEPLVRRAMLRWIAAAQGCDTDLEVDEAAAPGAPAPAAARRLALPD